MITMNGPDWIAYVILAFLAIMSVQFLRGKWSFLIAGYNTATEAEKAQYDEKKLCRVMGVCMGIITVLIAIMLAFDGQIPPGIMIFLILADVGVALVLSNTICKKKID